MQIEITEKQAAIIEEAFGLSLESIPPAQRVAVATMQYAPIMMLIQQAAKVETAGTEATAFNRRTAATTEAPVELLAETN